MAAVAAATAVVAADATKLPSPMAKVNFRHNKRQKELARKERQISRLTRRGERPPEEAGAAGVTIDPKQPPGGAK